MSAPTNLYAKVAIIEFVSIVARNVLVTCEICKRPATVQVYSKDMTKLTYLCDKHRNRILKDAKAKVDETGNIVKRVEPKETIH